MGIESLTNYGIDWEKGLANCIGDMNFYKKILGMFLEDGCFSHAKKAHEAGDRNDLFTRMHELKGISGNIALKDLYEATVPLVEMLRFDNGVCDKAEVDRLFVTCEEAYNRAYNGIEHFLAEYN